MSKLKELFDDLQIQQDTLRELASLLLENPMAVMTKVQEMNLPAEKIQQAMGIVMADPGEMTRFAEALGLDAKVVEEARSRLDSMMPK